MATEGMRAGMLRVPAWDRFSWLKHGFSTRVGGVSQVYGVDDLNLGFTAGDSPENVRQNRDLFTQAVIGCANAVDFVAVRQVHGAALHAVLPGEPSACDGEGRGQIDADGLVTQIPGTLLAIQVADCVPVLVADTRQRLVAAFHAGWRGTSIAIVEQGITSLQHRFGCRPEDLIAAIGPSIGACCYTVGEELREAFTRQFPYAGQLFSNQPGGLHLDLAQANRQQMLSAGLSVDAVTLLGECSACARLPDGSRKYFSYRAEQGYTGRMMAAIGVV